MDDTGRAASGRARNENESTRGMHQRMHAPSRVAALSDGVFAIIMTLLVLDIHVPDLGRGQSLAEALQQVRPTLIAFVVSFVLVAMYWVGHRDLFALVRETDRGLVWLNILFLLPLCLLPFAASLIGRYNLDPVALRIYGLILLAAAAMRLIIWLYGTRRPHLLWTRLDERQRRAGLALAGFPGLAYLLAILLSAVAPPLSLAIFAALPLLYFLSITVLRRGRKGEREYSDFT